MKKSLIHSASSVNLVLQVLAKSVRAPQNCLNESRSFCLRFNNLYLSKNVLGGLSKAVFRRFQNSVNEIVKIFTREFFEQRPSFLHCRVQQTKSNKAFCQLLLVSSLQIFFSSLIRVSSAASYDFMAVLFLISLLALPVSNSLPVDCSKIGTCYSGTLDRLRLSTSRFFSAISANCTWLLHWVQECGGSKVWFVHNEEIPRRFDSFDFAIMNISII